MIKRMNRRVRVHCKLSVTELVRVLFLLSESERFKVSQRTGYKALSSSALFGDPPIMVSSYSGGDHRIRIIESIDYILSMVAPLQRSPSMFNSVEITDHVLSTPPNDRSLQVGGPVRPRRGPERIRGSDLFFC